MRIDSLKYFYEVAEVKSISKVSNNLHISQPALSHQLSKIEKELGVKLLERSNRGVELTEKGKILYNYAKKILFLHENLIEELEESSAGKQEIKIGVSSVCAKFMVENIANSILTIFKNVNINISNTKETNEKGLLLHNRADIVLGCKKVDDSDLICSRIGSDRLILVSEKNVECHQRSNLSIAVLDDSLNMDLKNIKNLNLNNICLKTDSIDVIKSYLKNPNVGAIVPKIAVEKELRGGELVTLCSVAYSMEYNFYMTYSKNIDPNLKRKIKTLKSELEKILNQETLQEIS